MNLKMWMSTVAVGAIAITLFAAAPASAQCTDQLGSVAINHH